MKYGLESAWQDLTHASLQAVPRVWRDWLNDPHSLTERLQETLGQKIAVQVLQDGRHIVEAHEAALLDPRLHRARVREVFLSVTKDEPLVLARSILPKTSSTGLNREILQLGTKPLGEVLFSKKNPPILRRQISYFRHLGWGRRTVYSLRGHPILITEIFLPHLLAELSQGH